MNNDLDDFVGSEPAKAPDMMMSYVRKNTQSEVIINFTTLQYSSISGISSAGVPYYNERASIKFKGRIVKAIINEAMVKDLDCNILFPSKTFRNSLSVAGCTSKDLNEFTFVNIKFIKVNKQRYDILDIKRCNEW